MQKSSDENRTMQAQKPHNIFMFEWYLCAESQPNRIFIVFNIYIEFMTEVFWFGIVWLIVSELDVDCFDLVAVVVV